MKYCFTNACCGYRKNGICRDARFCPSSFTTDDLLKLGNALMFWRDDGDQEKAAKVQTKIAHMKGIIKATAPC